MLTKIQWSRGFQGIPGLISTHEDDNVLLSGGDRGRIICQIKNIGDYLDFSVKSTFCITEASGKYYGKSFGFRELISEMPGCIILDEFNPSQVVRWWSDRSTLEAINDNQLEKMLLESGRFCIE